MGVVGFIAGQDSPDDPGCFVGHGDGCDTGGLSLQQ